MLKKIGIGTVVLSVILFVTVGIGMAGQSSDEVVSPEKILSELKTLQEDLGKLEKKEMASEEGTLKERLEIAIAKEEVLYQLGVWRHKLITVLIAEAEKQAKKQTEINKSLMADIEDLKIEVSLAKEMAAKATVRADQAIEETRELAQQTEERIAMLVAKVEELVKKVKKLEEELGLQPEVKLKSESLK